MKESLKNSLNGLREVTSEIFHQYVPVITDDMDINSYASPILKDINLSNEFLSVLINRIVYTAIETKMFNNPLNGLKGEAIPLGYAGQEIYTNPAKGRRFNDNDFAGLLFKYEADVKIQYTYINQDIQYPVTVSQKAFKQAFVSWADLEKFINNLTTSLYNGAYIDEFKFTKYLVANAYRTGAAPVVITPEIQDESDAKEVVKIARKLYLDMQLPSEEFNAWKNVGGYGRPVTTWTEADDIVLLLRNDVRNEIDVDVLAQAFNIDKVVKAVEIAKSKYPELVLPVVKNKYGKYNQYMAKNHMLIEVGSNGTSSEEAKASVKYIAEILDEYFKQSK